ncbi:MAG: lytic transglycosylase domain-containing protein [Burkholderiales bacterium]
MGIGRRGWAVNEGSPHRKWGLWSRQLGSILVLLTSVSALALILTDHASKGRFTLAEASAFASVPVPAASDREQPGVTDAALMQAEEARYRALSEFVAKRYRVSQDAAFDLVTLAHRAGRQLQLDPLLIIAVIAIESRFNPIAESRAGAKGLMQIIPKYHGDKLEEFGGEQAVFEPEANIQVGARILKEYLRRTGNLGIALQMYAGALGDDEDQYTRKVLNERHRLQEVLPPSRHHPAVPVALRIASTHASHPNVLPSELD